MINSLSFIDLDNTLILSGRRRKDAEKYYPAGVDGKGKTASYISTRQITLMNMLREKGRVIPVTGRPSWALNRLQFEWNDLKIVSHGALIVDAKGNPVEEWVQETELKEKSAELAQFFEQWKPILAGFNGKMYRYRIIEDHKFPVYISVKGEPEIVRAALKKIREMTGFPKDYQLAQNDRTGAILPGFARKENAVKWIMRSRADENLLFLGAGDSQSDIPFLSLMDFVIIPGESQIMEALNK